MENLRSWNEAKWQMYVPIVGLREAIQSHLQYSDPGGVIFT